VHGDDTQYAHCMISVVHVDAFASKPFTGNPAAVCLLRDERPDAWMQAVGREFNLPATAFVTPRPGGDGFGLRWFTATAELELCGHGTLASAHALWDTGTLAAGEPARFHTRGGVLTAIRRDGWIEMDFPAAMEQEETAPAELIEGLGVSPIYVGRSSLDYLVEVENEQAVRAVQPDFRRIAKLPVRGFIVTSRSESENDDFVSRFFCPARGIDEDSVTGSAHCCLATFWSRRSAKQTFTARQLSARGGVLKVTLDGTRVRLAGQALTVSRSELLV
jgi:PhzF family phenazine biosynthesis protein